MSAEVARPPRWLPDPALTRDKEPNYCIEWRDAA